MNEEKFWQLIQQIDRSAFDEGDMDGAVEPLVDALGELPVKAIKKFEEILAKKLYALDGKVFADNAGEPGNSGDGFLYARCYVVGGGQATYDCVVAAPTLMPNDFDQWLEELLFVASQAWAEKTGRDSDEWDVETSVSYETGSNSAAWPAN